jgi:hypothetical protein
LAFLNPSNLDPDLLSKFQLYIRIQSRSGSETRVSFYSTNLLVGDKAAILLDLHGDVDDGTVGRELAPQDVLCHPVSIHVHRVACRKNKDAGERIKQEAHYFGSDPYLGFQLKANQNAGFFNADLLPSDRKKLATAQYFYLAAKRN